MKGPVIVSIDFDYFSVTLCQGQYKHIPSEQTIDSVAKRIIDTLLERGIRVVALNYTRSRGIKGWLFSEPSQSDYILGALQREFKRYKEPSKSMSSPIAKIERRINIDKMRLLTKLDPALISRYGVSKQEISAGSNSHNDLCPLCSISRVFIGGVKWIPAKSGLTTSFARMTAQSLVLAAAETENSKSTSSIPMVQSRPGMTLATGMRLTRTMPGASGFLQQSSVEQYLDQVSILTTASHSDNVVFLSQIIGQLKISHILDLAGRLVDGRLSLPTIKASRQYQVTSRKSPVTSFVSSPMLSKSETRNPHQLAELLLNQGEFTIKLDNHEEFEFKLTISPSEQGEKFAIHVFAKGKYSESRLLENGSVCYLYFYTLGQEAGDDASIHSASSRIAIELSQLYRLQKRGIADAVMSLALAIASRKGAKQYTAKKVDHDFHVNLGLYLVRTRYVGPFEKLLLRLGFKVIKENFITGYFDNNPFEYRNVELTFNLETQIIPDINISENQASSPIENIDFSPRQLNIEEIHRHGTKINKATLNFVFGGYHFRVPPYLVDHVYRIHLKGIEGNNFEFQQLGIGVGRRPETKAVILADLKQPLNQLLIFSEDKKIKLILLGQAEPAEEVNFDQQAQFSNMNRQDSFLERTKLGRRFLDTVLGIKPDGQNRAQSIVDALLKLSKDDLKLKKAIPINLAFFSQSYILVFSRMLKNNSFVSILRDREQRGRFVVVVDDLNHNNFVVFERENESVKVLGRNSRVIIDSLDIKRKAQTLSFTDFTEGVEFCKSVSRTLRIYWPSEGIKFTPTFKVSLHLGSQSREQGISVLKVEQLTKATTSGYQIKQRQPAIEELIASTYPIYLLSEQALREISLVDIDVKWASDKFLFFENENRQWPQFLGYCHNKQYLYYKKLYGVFLKGGKLYRVYRLIEESDIITKINFKEEAITISGIDWTNGNPVELKGIKSIALPNIVTRFAASKYIVVDPKLSKYFKMTEIEGTPWRVNYKFENGVFVQTLESIRLNSVDDLGDMQESEDGIIERSDWFSKSKLQIKVRNSSSPLNSRQVSFDAQNKIFAREESGFLSAEGRSTYGGSSPINSKIILEIDARALAATYGTVGSVPLEFWDWIASLGIGYIWIKAPWKNSRWSAKMMKQYSEIHKERIVERQASGYDVYDYELNPKVARNDGEFISVAKYLMDRGISVVTDLVINHIAADSPKIMQVPGLVFSYNDREFCKAVRAYFPEATQGISDEQLLNSWLQNPLTRSFYRFNSVRPDFHTGRIIRHAKFGYGSVQAGNLAQINYMDKRAREYMIKTVLKKIAKITINGGLRADLAHLALRSYIYEEWARPLGLRWVDLETLMPREFWQEFMEEVQTHYPQMLIVAETYDPACRNLLQNLGMIAYEKHIYDLLIRGEMRTLRWHLFLNNLPEGYLEKSIYFVENHDEPPAHKAFTGLARSLAAMTIMGALPGYLLVPLRQIFNMGIPKGAVMDPNQKSGDAAIYRFKYPDALVDDSCVNNRLVEMLKFLNHDVFKNGKLYSANIEDIGIDALLAVAMGRMEFSKSGASQFQPISLEDSGIFTCVRHLRNQDALILVNYSNLPKQVKIDLNNVFFEYDRQHRDAPGVISGELKNKLCSQGVRHDVYGNIYGRKSIITLPAWGYYVSLFDSNYVQGLKSSSTKPETSSSPIKNELLLKSIKDECPNDVREYPRVLSAFSEIDRAQFLRPDARQDAQFNTPLYISSTQVTSQPSLLFQETCRVNPQEQEEVLELGSGRGYLTAILSKLAKKVTSLEMDKSLVRFCRNSLRKAGVTNVLIKCTDAIKYLNRNRQNNFDAIVISFAIERQLLRRVIFPRLKENGRLIAPVVKEGISNRLACRCSLELYIKSEGRIKKQLLGEVYFAPRISKSSSPLNTIDSDKKSDSASSPIAKEEFESKLPINVSLRSSLLKRKISLIDQVNFIKKLEKIGNNPFSIGRQISRRHTNLIIPSPILKIKGQVRVVKFGRNSYILYVALPARNPYVFELVYKQGFHEVIRRRIWISRAQRILDNYAESIVRENPKDIILRFTEENNLALHVADNGRLFILVPTSLERVQKLIDKREGLVHEKASDRKNIFNIKDNVTVRGRFGLTEEELIAFSPNRTKGTKGKEDARFIITLIEELLKAEQNNKDVLEFNSSSPVESKKELSYIEIPTDKGLLKVEISVFPDGEICPRALNHEIIKGAVVEISHAINNSNDLVKIVLLMDMLHQYQAKKVIFNLLNKPDSFANGLPRFLRYFCDAIFDYRNEESKQVIPIKILDIVKTKATSVWVHRILYQHTRFKKDAEEAARSIHGKAGRIKIDKSSVNPLMWKVSLPGDFRPEENVMLVHSTENALDFVELWMILIALREAGISKIFLLNTYEGYARQDKIFKPGQVLSAVTMLKAVDPLVDFHGALNVHYGIRSGWVELGGYKIYNFNAFIPLAEGMFDILVRKIKMQPKGMIKLEKKLHRGLRRMKKKRGIVWGARPLLRFSVKTINIIHKIGSRLITPLKKRITVEFISHPLLVLAPDDGAFKYALEAASLLKEYILKNWSVDAEVYCGYMDKTRLTGDKTAMPPYILGLNGEKIWDVGGVAIESIRDVRTENLIQTNKQKCLRRNNLLSCYSLK